MGGDQFWKRRQKVIHLIGQGVKPPEIARIVGVGKWVIYNDLRELRVSDPESLPARYLKPRKTKKPTNDAARETEGPPVGPSIDSVSKGPEMAKELARSPDKEPEMAANTHSEGLGQSGGEEKKEFQMDERDRAVVDSRLETQKERFDRLLFELKTGIGEQIKDLVAQVQTARESAAVMPDIRREIGQVQDKLGQQIAAVITQVQQTQESAAAVPDIRREVEQIRVNLGEQIAAAMAHVPQGLCDTYPQMCEQIEGLRQRLDGIPEDLCSRWPEVCQNWPQVKELLAAHDTDASQPEINHTNFQDYLDCPECGPEVKEQAKAWAKKNLGELFDDANELAEKLRERGFTVVKQVTQKRSII